MTLHGKYWNEAGITGRFHSHGRADELYSEFEDATGGKAFGFAQDRLVRPAPVIAAELRDDAEAARAVAAQISSC